MVGSFFEIYVFYGYVEYLHVCHLADPDSRQSYSPHLEMTVRQIIALFGTGQTLPHGGVRA